MLCAQATNCMTDNLPRSGLGHKHDIVLDSLMRLIDSDEQGERAVRMASAKTGAV